MRKVRLFSAVPLLLLFSVAACDSTTDLASVSASGVWKSVGPLQGVTLFVSPESNGNFSGSWTTQAGATGAITEGSNSGGVVRFTLQGFEGGSRPFEGGFTNELRLEGSLSGVALSGAAVFRRTSF